MSERQYAVRVGLSRGAIQKAKASERLVLFPDGTIDADASDARRAATTDPAKSRSSTAAVDPPAPKPRMKPVPEAAVSAVGETLREQGLAAPAAGGSMTFLQAKAANEVLKAQERRIRLQKLKGELVDRAHVVHRHARLGEAAPRGRIDAADADHADPLRVDRRQFSLAQTAMSARHWRPRRAR